MAALGTAVPAADGSGAAHEHELRVLYEIIHTVNSTLDLEQVLGAIVRLVNDAIVAHATYIFLSEDRGRRIVLRAASDHYAHLSGRVSMAAGEGIAGWVLQNGQPVFIPEKALADPRIKYFPELEEEKYQSLVSVPLIAKGQRVIGVIALHAEAPRVFSPQDAAFLLHVASLVAYAIENARLYERTRRSLRELEQLSQLGAHIARAESVDDLLSVTVEQALGLLGAESLRIYLLEPSGDRLRMRAASPGAPDGPDIVSLPELSGELQRSQAGGGTLTSVLAGTLWGESTMRSALVAPLVAGDEVMGFLVARLADDRRASEHARDLANSIASQSALGIKRLQLVERLAERNLIKDLFDALASGRGTTAIAAQARRLGIDAAGPVAVAWALPAAPGAEATAAFLSAAEAFEAAALRDIPGALVDRAEDALRLLAPALAGESVLERIEAIAAAAPGALAVGISNVCSGPGACAAGFAEAQQAARALPVLRAGARHLRYDELGVYKYLLRVPPGERVRDKHADALRVLAEHDRRRNAQLLQTLEEFLRRRGHVGATAQALYVHPNTLRQRLRRIEELTGLDARDADWLLLEVALKLQRLEEVYPPGHTPG
jgi:GAF domain-containing protein